MTIEGGETAADVLTGAVAADAIDTEAGRGRAERGSHPRVCLNCGATLTGRYCAMCGQSAHIRRDFRSIGHDVLHSVFHFDGKFWRTIPELAFRPGRLTRRYIEGERAKFVSPMALFLFTVFAMYGVFAFAPGVDWNGPPPFAAEAVDSMEADAEALRRRLDTPGISAEERLALEQQLADLEIVIAMARAAASEDWERYDELGAELRSQAERANAADAERIDPGETPSPAEADGQGGNALSRALQKLEDDPDLVFYKMKANGYKWSWLLVPLSIPFMWLLFFWRREFNLYDHAVFVTYSISFMMILLILSTLASIAGVGSGLSALLLMLSPPVHLYSHLRGTYRLSRLSALVRLFFVLLAAAIALSVFVTTLLVTGALE
ncbi:MAG TPA: DUF3667 domain-containing protein [Gammaproteobacteria bacterium]